MPYTRTVLITGGTGGLGKEAALVIARKQPSYLIILASRSDSSSTASSINTALAQTNTIFLPLDLSSISSIRAFVASYVTKSYPPIAALLLNAALQFPTGLHFSADNIESTFAITHVGNALLFHLLTSSLADDCRIVVTASGTHDPAQKSGLPDAKYTTAEELAHPKPESSTEPGRQRYATAKLCNVLWTYALNRRIEKVKPNWTVVAFDPGFMPVTGLAREANRIEKFLAWHVLPKVIPLLRRLVNKNINTPKESGLRLAKLALGEMGKGRSGVYFELDGEIKSSVDSYVIEKQEDLWEWTVGNLAADDEEKMKFEKLA